MDRFQTARRTIATVLMPPRCADPKVLEGDAANRSEGPSPDEGDELIDDCAGSGGLPQSFKPHDAGRSGVGSSTEGDESIADNCDPSMPWAPLFQPSSSDSAEAVDLQHLVKTVETDARTGARLAGDTTIPPIQSDERQWALSQMALNMRPALMAFLESL